MKVLKIMEICPQTTSNIELKMSLKCSCEGGRQFRTPVALRRTKTFRLANDVFSSAFVPRFN